MSGWKKLLKVVAGVAVGLALLDLFCTGYYNPAGYLYDDSRATDVIREPGRFTARANEGFSWAIIDENGYNNRELPGEDGIFALVMGSSHTEGLYVPPGDDVSSQLGDLLAEGGVKGAVYNIATSGHHLARNVMNLDRALTRFAPSDYVVLETQDVMLYRSDILGALDDSLKRADATGVVISKWLSERPLLRTIYRQIMVLRSAGDEAVAQAARAPVEITPDVLRQYKELLLALFEKLRATADAHGVEPIIYYHPALLLQEDGSAALDNEPSLQKVFAEACAETNIAFVDLTEDFLAAYEREHILTHGFVNTAPGAGHLNAEGCRMAAEAICAEILRMEAAK